MSSVARYVTSSTDRVVAPRTDVKRAIVRLAVVLVALQVVFVGLLVVAQAVPDDRIVAHLLEAVEDGTYASNSAPDNMGGTSSSFTECVAIGTGLGRPELGPWERAVRMPRIGNCAEGPEDLRRLERGESLGEVEEYFRYWAGWTVVTRPVLALWGLEALRRISGALLFFSAVGAVVVVARRATPAYAVGLMIPLLVASNVMATPSSSVEQALSFSVAFVSVAVTAWGASHGLEGAALGAAAGAALYIFVEFLIAPAIPWMLSVSVAGAVTFARTAQLDRTARAVGVTSVVWPLALLFTWATRWALAVLFLGWDHSMDVVRSKVSTRLGGASSSVSNEFGASTRANLRYWLDTISTAWAVVLVVIVVVVATLIVGYRRLGPAGTRAVRNARAPGTVRAAVLRAAAQLLPDPRDEGVLEHPRGGRGRPRRSAVHGDRFLAAERAWQPFTLDCRGRRRVARPDLTVPTIRPARARRRCAGRASAPSSSATSRGRRGTGHPGSRPCRAPGAPRRARTRCCAGAGRCGGRRSC